MGFHGSGTSRRRNPGESQGARGSAHEDLREADQLSTTVRVAMVCNRSAKSVNSLEPMKIYYHFFMDALPRHRRLDIDFIGHYANRLDVVRIVRDHDVVLLPQLDDPSQALALRGISDHDIPVIAKSGDPHAFLSYDMMRACADLGVDHLFEHVPEAAIYRYWPSRMRYHRIPYGVEPSLYGEVRPWDERVDDRIVLSGALDKPDLLHYLYQRIYKRRPAALSSNHHYRLRTKCNRLPYVIHARRIWPGTNTDQFPLVMSSFRAAIAATTNYHTTKYMETPAAGCLTFMEATDLNQAATLGYEDGRTAVFVNESNYTRKFQEYLDSPDDPKWRKIADAGRAYTMEHLTNDTAADKMYTLMRTALGES